MTTVHPSPNASSDGNLPTRLGGILGLVAFAYTLLAGLFEADNPFATIVVRAIVAMLGMLVVGYLIGWVAQAMLNENLRDLRLQKESLKENPESNEESATDGR